MTSTALAADDTMVLAELTLQLRVTEKKQLAPDVISLTLASVTGQPLPTWDPGAHVDLVLPNGLVRQYSLCGSTQDLSTYRVGVLRETHSRGGSKYVHDELTVGDEITVRPPLNRFRLEPSGRYVFAGGGIGVTPLIAMAEEAQRTGAEFVFLYCARSREAMGFLAELQERFGRNLVVNADDESGLFDLGGYFADVRADTMVYACGPAPFLDATVRATKDWPSGAVHFERFEALEFDDRENVPFEVELARSGKVLTVPADRSVLQVLSDVGIRVLSSCTEGTCGTCETAVLSGGPIDHRDAVLSPEEQESGEMMMVCVSRCQGGRLLLDL